MNVNPVTKRPFGAFQLEVMAILADNPGTTYNPLRRLKGTAARYWGRYRESLRTLEALGLVKEVEGPKGGRDYYIATERLLGAIEGGN